MRGRVPNEVEALAETKAEAVRRRGYDTLSKSIPRTWRLWRGLSFSIGDQAFSSCDAACQIVTRSSNVPSSRRLAQTPRLAIDWTLEPLCAAQPSMRCGARRYDASASARRPAA